MGLSKINENELAEILSLYMQDNDIDYLHIRASLNAKGDEIKMVIYSDLEDEDDDNIGYYDFGLN
jgi:hypothetical protein